MLRESQASSARRRALSIRFSSVLWAISAVAVCACVASAAGSSNIVSYQIRASLDPAAHSIVGHEIVAWRNTSAESIGELQFHLYLNAFQNEKSTFMRESGGKLRGSSASRRSWGWIDINRIRVVNGPDLTAAIRYLHPDDDNAADRTVMAVSLPRPIRPDGTIELAIEFVSKLPQVFARTGYFNEFYMVGQWFPKIAVYQDGGPGGGGRWNCHQYHAATEFFADFGSYDVSITTPDNYITGATGVRTGVNEDSQRRTKTFRYYQDNVHDFAWTASPRFIEIERRFDPARSVKPADVTAAQALLDLSPQELTLKPVRMVLLIQPENLGQADRHFRALENAIKWYGLWYGAYPYESITLVDPPHGASGAFAVEYPTLVAIGTSWWPGHDERNPEELIAHEFGHQYWYGMVATNEFEEAWLDEGFTTYSTSKLMDFVYGPRRQRLQVLGIPIGGLLGTPAMTSDTLNRSAYLYLDKSDPVARHAWKYYDYQSFAINSYMRPAVLLRTLENYLGPHVMARTMRTWFQRYRFRHPTAAEFENVVNEVAGRDLSWFFDQFVAGSERLNYRVGSVRNEPVRSELGSFVHNGARVAVAEIEAEAKKAGQEYRITVKLQREGEAVFPVEMKMTLEDGQTVREQWDGRERWVKFDYVKPTRAVAVEIDPEHKVLLDRDLADNSWSGKLALRPFAKWGTNVLFWVQMVLP